MQSHAEERFRILSIDGGGIKGVLPAAFLASIEDVLGVPINKYFDLIAGTSTGGILAIGLGLGFSARELRDFYIEEGPKIFNSKLPGWRVGVFKPKHSSEPLKQALAERFTDKKIGDSKTRLIIPTFNGSKAEIHIYKTRHHAKLDMDHRISALEVAMATTAAPVYLPSFKGSQGITFVDGGLWANNPVGYAAVEAITLLGRKPNELRILSLGCTQIAQSFSKLKAGKDWALLPPIEAALVGQSGGSLGIAQSIAGHENVYRINPVVPAGKFSLDGSGGIDELRGLGESEARHEIPKLKPVFFARTVQPFTPAP